MSGLAFCLCVVAFLLFGLATEAHHRRRCRATWSPRRGAALRGAAWAALAIAFAAAVSGAGWAFGAVLWTGAVMTGAAAAFLILNLSPAWVRQSFTQRR